ncbi:MAG: outer membrane beta-barrel protein [Gammaproteobacteria bacterium]
MQTKPRNGFLLFLLLGLFIFFNCAESGASTLSSFKQGRWYMDIAGGASSVSMPGQTSVSNGTLLMFPLNNDTYSTHSPYTNLNLGLGGGYQWQFDRTYVPYFNLGIQYTHIFTSHVEGSVTQFSLPIFNNYNYKFDYDANVLVLNGKLDLIEYHSFLPYIALGIGAAYNDFSNYHEYAKPSVTPRTTPNYGSHNTANFTYTLGAGVDYHCSNKIWLSLGYEYDSLDKLKSNRGRSTWSTTQLTFDSLKNNMVFASLSYFPATL